MAEPDQFTLNPSIAPAGILAAHPQQEVSDRRAFRPVRWRSHATHPGEMSRCRRSRGNLISPIPSSDRHMSCAGERCRSEEDCLQPVVQEVGDKSHEAGGRLDLDTMAAVAELVKIVAR